MKERPILFSGPMVRAILAGQKTVTRRIVTERSCGKAIRPPSSNVVGKVGDGVWEWRPAHDTTLGRLRLACPHGVPGDRLWVRETWAQPFPGSAVVPQPFYRADGPTEGYDTDGPWRPSIFMPRALSRITLEILSVRAERLQDITEEDAKAEGVRPFFETFSSFGRDQRITSGEHAADAEHRAGFAVLWDEINGDRALWITNPWVWRVEFKRAATEPAEVDRG